MLEAARTADRLDKLAAILAKEGLMPTNGKGDPIAHPALVEAPQQQLALGRTLNSLRIPASGEEGWDDHRGSARNLVLTTIRDPRPFLDFR